MPEPTETLPRLRRPRRIARPLLWLIFVGSSIGSVAALASDWHWFADLFTHFRLYYLLAQGLLVVAFLNTRRYAWLVATLVLAVPNAWYVGPYLWPLVAGPPAVAAVSERPQVLTINLSYKNRDTARVVDYIVERRPDTIVLSEYTSAWHSTLERALADWTHRVVRPRETPFGMAVYSRTPLRSAQWLDLGVHDIENLRVELADGLVIYAVHLVPPMSEALARARNRQLAALADALAQTPGPRLVTGDLNLTPFSPHFSRLLDAAGVDDARRAQGLHVTWPAMPLPLWIPIDHTLADAAAGVVDVRTGPDIGSDHFPLEIRLAPQS